MENLDIGYLVEVSLKIIVVLGLLSLLVPIIMIIEKIGIKLLHQKIYSKNSRGAISIQPIKTLVKVMTKQTNCASQSRNRVRIFVAMFIFIVALLPFVGIPICEPFQIGQQEIKAEVFSSPLGIFFVLIATTFSTYAIILSTIFSKDRFSLMENIKPGFYTIGCDLSLYVVVSSLILAYGSENIHIISQSQNVFLSWGIFKQPIAFFVFLAGIFLKGYNEPVNLCLYGNGLNSEQGLSSSPMGLVLFVFTKHLNLITMATIITILFLGGYQILPGLSSTVEDYPGMIYFFQGISMGVKVIMIISMCLLSRLILPEFKIDHLIWIGWRRLFPLSIINLCFTVMFIYYRDLIK